MKKINTLCEQNMEFLNITAGGKYSFNQALNGQQRTNSAAQGTGRKTEAPEVPDEYFGLL